MKKSISLSELQAKTDEWLSWIEERKMNGFLGEEIQGIRSILHDCLERDTCEDLLEYLKDRIRREICERWNPTAIGKKYERYHNRTPRAEVMRQFPDRLRNYLNVLSQVETNELDDDENELFQFIIIRIQVSLMSLELNANEKKEQPEKTKKSGRSKPPRCNK